jgi:hypothetical protein
MPGTPRSCSRPAGLDKVPARRTGIIIFVWALARGGLKLRPNASKLC